MTQSDLVHEVFGKEVIEHVLQQHGHERVPYANYDESWPKPIAILKILKFGLSEAFKIHGEILNPNKQSLESTEQQYKLLLAFLELDADMVGIQIHGPLSKYKDEYMKASLNDPPLGDWCGFGGSNPVEVAFKYVSHIHFRIICAMRPQLPTLTQLEKADSKALTERPLCRLLKPLKFTPAKWRLRPELVMRRLAVAMPLPWRFGEPPDPGDLNNLRERLDRIQIRLAQTEPGTEESLDTGRSQQTKNDSEQRFQFEQIGESWHLQFISSEEETEHGIFSNAKGFSIYGKLLACPGVPVSALELMKSDEAIRLPVPKMEMDPNILTVSSYQETLDPDALNSIKAELNKIDEMIEVAESTGNDARVSELKAVREELMLYHSKDLGLFGKSRELGPGSDRDKARKAVRESINRARKKIGKHMPLLAEYLESTIEAKDYGFRYSPPRQIDWKL